eukprot:3423223-Prymnesium_polylepis.1
MDTKHKLWCSIYSLSSISYIYQSHEESKDKSQQREPSLRANARDISATPSPRRPPVRWSAGGQAGSTMARQGRRGGTVPDSDTRYTLRT